MTGQPDAEFFRANPGRAHRLRLATASEIAEDAGFWLGLSHPCFLFAAIRQPEPGLRYGFLFSAAWPPPVDVDDEETARRVFHRVAMGGQRLALSIVTSGGGR